jgi:integrase
MTTTVKVRGIKKVTVHKKGQTYTYFYHRKTKRRVEDAGGIPLTPDDGVRFAAAVEALDQLIDFRVPTTPDGTWGGLVTAYKASPEFHLLSQRTKRDYLRVLDYLKPLRRMPLVEMDTPFVLGVRQKAFGKMGLRWANYTVSVISVVHTWGGPHGWVKGNPAIEVKKLKKPKGARKVNRAWGIDEVQVTLGELDKGVLTAFAISIFAGFPEGDVIVMPWEADRGDRFIWDRKKTGNPIEQEIDPGLRVLLDQEKARVTAWCEEKGRKMPATIITTRSGKPFTESGFRASFFAVIRRLTKEGRVRPGLTFHGLRHTIGKWITDAGGNSRDVAAFLQQRTTAMGEHYSSEADSNRRAAAASLLMEHVRNKVLENQRTADGKPLPARRAK